MSAAGFGTVDVEVRPAVRADAADMTAVLAEAFADDDPVGEFLFPDSAVRHRRQPRMFSAVVKHRFIPQRSALVATVDDEIVGTLMWEPSSKRRTPIHDAVGNLELLDAMRERVGAGIRMDALLAGLVPVELTGKPHVIGVYCGCLPKVQRRGVGRALFSELFEACDGNGAAFYFVCKDGNVDYYRALGCEVIAQRRLGGSGPQVNVMIRTPRDRT